MKNSTFDSNIINKLHILVTKYKNGELGGEYMPEDKNPGLPTYSKENFSYFTLPMALNYQRDSYKLWESAYSTYTDPSTNDIFDLNTVCHMEIDTLRNKLLKHKLALQPNKQPIIWRRLCETFSSCYSGDIRLFFEAHQYNVSTIKKYMQTNKKDFPYLSGEKIMNYWLYVMSNYTELALCDRQNISIAPDTHVLQSSIRLGVIKQEDLKRNDIRQYTSERWKILCDKAGLIPIDLHTPLWLWSRNNFSCEI